MPASGSAVGSAAAAAASSLCMASRVVVRSQSSSSCSSRELRSEQQAGRTSLVHTPYGFSHPCWNDTIAQERCINDGVCTQQQAGMHARCMLHLKSGARPGSGSPSCDGSPATSSGRCAASWWGAPSATAACGQHACISLCPTLTLLLYSPNSMAAAGHCSDTNLWRGRIRMRDGPRTQHILQRSAARRMQKWYKAQWHAGGAQGPG